MGQEIANLAEQTAEVFTGGDTLREAATGGDIQRGLQVDAAGLSAGSGIASSGIATSLTGGTSSTLMPAAVPETASSLAAQGLVQTGPGVFEALAAPAAAGGTLASVGSALKTASTILAPTASIAASASSIKAARKLGSGAPLIAPKSDMPSNGNANTITAQRASVTEQLRRRGRAATILTSPPDERLGG